MCLRLNHWRIWYNYVTLPIISRSEVIMDLQKLHTKQLLNRLDELRRIPWCDCGCWRTEDSKEAEPKIAAIKEVLKTREHVRNKKEA